MTEIGLFRLFTRSSCLNKPKKSVSVKNFDLALTLTLTLVFSIGLPVFHQLIDEAEELPSFGQVKSKKVSYGQGLAVRVHVSIAL